MRCRENRSYGDFDACFLHALAKLIICAADCVLTFHVSSPYRLENARRLFDCVSFTVYRSSYCHTVLNADGRVHTVTCIVCAFFTFFLTQFFTPFYNCTFLFTAYSFFSFIPIFTRTSFIVLNFKTLKNTYCWQTVRFKLSQKGKKTNILKEKPKVTHSCFNVSISL